MKRLFRQVGFAIAVILVVPLVSAHAHLDRAVPAAGSVVRASPKEIQLWFTQRLEPAFSKIEVLDRNGTQVDRSEARVDAADAALLRVALPPLKPGRYRVKWRVLSVDSHVTEGDYTFDVAP